MNETGGGNIARDDRKNLSLEPDGAGGLSSLGQLEQALLLPERLVEPDSWAGHIPFAFWITGAARPRRYVELGVHTGNSFCAVAQAVAHLGIDTECFGIDHWFGDEQAGLYGEDVYSDLKAWHDPRYGHFSRLLRMSFLDGRSQLPDRSVDLLHIDGLHTYEAVREDFETWQGKMSDRCVVLFHDTNVHQPDFGVWRFWQEIQDRYPSVEFLHSNGLGVAYTGAAPLDSALPGMARFFGLSQSDTGLSEARAFFARLGEPLRERIWSDQTRRRGEQLARELQSVYQNLAALDNDRSLVIADRDNLRDRALQWDKLAVRMGGSISLDLNDVSQALHQLFNSNNPQARRDKEILKRQFAELNRYGTFKPSYKDLIVRQAERIGRKAKSTLLGSAEATNDSTVVMIRESELFDEDYYALTEQARAAGRDPLEHYLSEGEEQGIAPSKSFDPVYYGRRHPDVAKSGYGLLRHYVLFGKQEKRTGVGPAARLDLRALPQQGRPKILFILPDAERSDVVELGFNLVLSLNKTHDVVAFFKKGGPLRAAFAEICAATVDMPEEPSLHRVDRISVMERLAREVKPAFAIAMSLDTREYVRDLTAANVGLLQFVDDFVGSVTPAGGVYDFLPFAHRIAFPSQAVAGSYQRKHPFLARRRFDIARPSTTVSPDLRSRPFGTEAYSEVVRRKVRPVPHKKEFLVVGVGDVSLHQGTDTFAQLAAKVRSLDVQQDFRFVWVGKIRDEENEFLPLLKDQIERCELGDCFELIDELEDHEELFQQADALALTSRSAPLPLVGTNALAAGIPVLCFEGASSLAEQLRTAGAHGASLVVPFLDVSAMAARLASLADDRQAYDEAADTCRELSAQQARPERFVAEIIKLGEEAAADARAVEHERAIVAKHSNAFSEAVYRGTWPVDNYPQDPLQNYLLRSRIARGKRELPTTGLRRPLPGFNPIIYLEDRLSGDDATEPLTHWLENGRPLGRWTHPLVSLSPASAPAPSSIKTLLHGHFYYVELLEEFLTRLDCNRSSIDLVLTVPDEVRASSAREILTKHPLKGTVEVVVTPNQGRDIGPFLSGLDRDKLAPYEIIGHIHSKKSPHIEAITGDQWRSFLWEHVVGGRTPAADICIAAMEADPKLGLIFPEDANLHGWDANMALAEPLVRSMGRQAPLPVAFEWPIGTMFWARRDAIAPLLKLDLQWKDYPPEPLPEDGTLLHALERVIPFAVEQAGYTYAASHLQEVQR